MDKSHFTATVLLRFNIWLDQNDSLTLSSYTVDDTGDTSAVSANSVVIGQKCYNPRC